MSGTAGEGWRGPGWIIAESPGGLGAPEVWIDAHALDYRSTMAPLAMMTAGNGRGPWVGRRLQFGGYPGAEHDEITYMIVARRHSSANDGRPYYVAKIPDQETA